MALTMGQLKKLLKQSGTTGTSQEAVVAQLVADALLRSAGRQAIIAAAADAVAQLNSAGNGVGFEAGALRQLLASLPGGPIGEEGGTDNGGGGSESGLGPG